MLYSANKLATAQKRVESYRRIISVAYIHAIHITTGDTTLDSINRCSPQSQRSQLVLVHTHTRIFHEIPVKAGVHNVWAHRQRMAYQEKTKWPSDNQPEDFPCSQARDYRIMDVYMRVHKRQVGKPIASKDCRHPPPSPYPEAK